MRSIGREIVEIFDGVRVIRVQVWDEETDIMSDSSLTGEES